MEQATPACASRPFLALPSKLTESLCWASVLRESGLSLPEPQFGVRPDTSIKNSCSLLRVGVNNKG